MKKPKRFFQDYSWKMLLSSAVFRLIVITLAVVIPLNLLTLILSRQVITEVERQISMETENALGLVMTQIDSAIQIANENLISMAVNDPDYRRLSDKKVTDKSEYYQQVQNLVNLQITMEDKLEGNHIISNCFVYFPEKGYFVLADRGGDAGQIRSAVKAQIDLGDGLLFRKGTFLNVEGVPILLRIIPYRSGWCGWWIQLDSLAGMLRYSGEEIIAISDAEGNVSYSSDPELKKLELDDTFRKYNKIGYTLAKTSSGESEMVLVQIVPKSEISNSLPEAIRVLQILSFATVLIIPTLMIAIQRLVITPVGKLTDAMERVETGELNYRIPEERYGSEFDRINRNFNHMMDEVAELKVNVYEEQLKAQKVHSAFLAQQIKPHFILNTLNILYSYEPEEFPLIQRMIMLLSRYFRYSVNASQDFVPLGKEMEHLRNYFAIQQTRFVRSFRAEIQFDEALADCLIPPLLIHTFAENAIKHVLVPGKTIDIIVSAAFEAPGRVLIRVRDTGAGIPDEVLERIHEFQKTREFSKTLGVGIQNSVDRMYLLYGGDAALTVDRGKEGGTVIEIHIPYRKEERDESDPD